jgi:uncharacterized protein
MCGKTRELHARLLVVPGLNDSGPAHWQSWLQSLHRDALRVRQRDWSEPDLDRWAGRIVSTMERDDKARWVVAAHSFGCLALGRLAALRPDLPIEAALLVAPADPDRFGVAGLLPQTALPYTSTLVGSRTDPWLSAAKARLWSLRWRSHFVDLGDAGHINAEAGFGPLPLAQRWVTSMQQRLERRHREASVPAAGWSFAI